MPPLNGAFAFAQMNDVAVLIAQHLHFNVTRPFNQLFQIDFARTKSALGFARSAAHGGGEFGFFIDAAHAFAPATGCRFEQNRVTEFSRNLARRLWGRSRLFRCQAPPARPP